MIEFDLQTRHILMDRWPIWNYFPKVLAMKFEVRIVEVEITEADLRI